MKTKRLIHILAAILGGLTVVGGLDATGILNILPDDWAAILATVPPACLGLGHTVRALGDKLDNGVMDNSFPGNSPG
jgi:hypothetical protein